MTSTGTSHLRLDGVARYIQEVGAENLVDAGEAEEHPHWLVQRTVIDVIEPIEFPNDVSFSRWCSALSSRWCTMRVDLVGSDGGRIETEGFWIAINSKTLTPQRVSDTLIERFASTTDIHRLKWRPVAEEPRRRRRDDAIRAAPHGHRHLRTRHQHRLLARDPRGDGPGARRLHAALSGGDRVPPPIKYGEDVTLEWVRHGDGGVHDVQIALTVDDDVRAAALLRKL